MGRYWALWLFSLVLRGLGVVGLVLTLITACIASAVPFVGVLWFIYGALASLSVYGAGQFIVLMMSIHENSMRAAGVLSPRRRQQPQVDPMVEPWVEEDGRNDFRRPR